MLDAQKACAGAMVAMALSISAALAHDWYPRECCSERDCMPADAIGSDERGDMIVMVGRRRIWVPRHFQVRASPDHRVHICFRADDFGVLMPLCLFVPAES